MANKQKWKSQTNTEEPEPTSTREDGLCALFIGMEVTGGRRITSVGYALEKEKTSAAIL